METMGIYVFERNGDLLEVAEVQMPPNEHEKDVVRGWLSKWYPLEGWTIWADIDVRGDTCYCASPC